MYCSHCGRGVKAGAQFCANCGAQLRKAKPVPGVEDDISNKVAYQWK